MNKIHGYILHACIVNVIGNKMRLQTGVLFSFLLFIHSICSVDYLPIKLIQFISIPTSNISLNYAIGQCFNSTRNSPMNNEWC